MQFLAVSIKEKVMKKIILAVALCLSTLAHADVIGSFRNNSGGKIVLTNEKCWYNGKDYVNWRKIYTFTSEGKTTEGCYQLEDEDIHAIWGGTEERRYSYDGVVTKKPTNYQ
jgi:hypothetical protein